MNAERTISNPEDTDDTGDDIPTLTAVVDEAAPTPVTDPDEVPRSEGIDEAALAELEVRLASASLDLTDRLLHTAFQEMEAAMFEQVSNRLRAELPDLVARIIREHFEETS